MKKYWIGDIVKSLYIKNMSLYVLTYEVFVSKPVCANVIA